LTKETIARFEVLVPPLPLLRRYGEISAPSQSLRDGMRQEVENLRKTRDLLLPRLLSGQLDLGDAA
jgi:type I restriction enzyme S subunit